MCGVGFSAQLLRNQVTNSKPKLKIMEAGPSKLSEALLLLRGTERVAPVL